MVIFMKLRQITGSALLAAVGVLLPQVFHMIGGTVTGAMFLPMHIPVLLAGMLYGPMCGASVGVLAPTLSFLIFTKHLKKANIRVQHRYISLINLKNNYNVSFFAF